MCPDKSQTSITSNNLSQAIMFTVLKMGLAGATQPIFVAKTHAQANLNLRLPQILAQTVKSPFKGVLPAVLREGKAPFKYVGAYLGNKAATDVMAPLFNHQSGYLYQSAILLTRGGIAGIVEGVFSTGINAWRTYCITTKDGKSYANFLKQGNDASMGSMSKKAFRGLGPTTFKQGVMTGLTFAALDLSNLYITPFLPEKMDDKAKRIIKSISTGAMVATSVALFDTAIVHIQSAGANEGKSFYSHCTSILKSHGLKGLVRGSGFNTVLLTIGTSVNALFFDSMRQNSSMQR